MFSSVVLLIARSAGKGSCLGRRRARLLWASSRSNAAICWPATLQRWCSQPWSYLSGNSHNCPYLSIEPESDGVYLEACQ